MAVYLLRYVHPDSPEWQAQLGPHVHWLLARLEDGSLLASGPVEGEGAHEALLVVEAESAEQVVEIARTDPYWQAGLVVEHSVQRWDPIFGAFNAHSSRAGQTAPREGDLPG